MVNDNHLFAQGFGSMRVVQAYAEPSLIASDPGYLNAFTTTAFNHTSSWLTHIQFDMLPWDTDPGRVLEEIEALASIGLGVILQAHGPAMRTLGPQGCARALSPFAPSLSHVLFDASHGTGKRLDAAALAPFLDAAASSQALAHVGLGVAGGLDVATVPSLAPLLVDHPDLSWDAEGRLHPERPNGARPLDMDAVNAYLRASALVLGVLPDLRLGRSVEEAS